METIKSSYSAKNYGHDHNFTANGFISKADAPAAIGRIRHNRRLR